MNTMHALEADPAALDERLRAMMRDIPQPGWLRAVIEARWDAESRSSEPAPDPSSGDDG